MDNNILTILRTKFGDALQENVRLANYTTINIGGPADAMLIAHNANQLEEMIEIIWELGCPVKVLGSGSNILMSDKGFRGVVVINHAHNIKINTRNEPLTAWAESGALMVNLGRQLALRGLCGMEWAATIPGTVGGAVYGNAGAFGKETCLDLISAEILEKSVGKNTWISESLDFSYRASSLKRNRSDAVILSATFHVGVGNPNDIQEAIEKFRLQRNRNQPPGASMGSVFRNPPEDKAGRLIEAAGLKGKRVGGATISLQHANFIINSSEATANDVVQLMAQVIHAVQKKFNIRLVPEIEVVGDWDDLPDVLQDKSRQAVER